MRSVDDADQELWLPGPDPLRPALLRTAAQDELEALGGPSRERRTATSMARTEGRRSRGRYGSPPSAPSGARCGKILPSRRLRMEQQRREFLGSLLGAAAAQVLAGQTR